MLKQYATVFITYTFLFLQVHTHICPGTSDGLYADTSVDCSMYLVCEHMGTDQQRVTQMPCPHGLKFDNAKQFCNWPSETQCGNDGVMSTKEPCEDDDTKNTLPDEIFTEKPEGDTEEPEIITDELEIVTEKPEIVTEEPEIVTEEPEIVTEEPEIVTEELEIVTEEPEIVTEESEIVTEDFEITTGKPKVTTPLIKLKCPGRQNILYADKASGCKNYYVCIEVGTLHERALLMPCAAGTLFNQKIQVCDWPDNVSC